jgi:hypothetical protein
MTKAEIPIESRKSVRSERRKGGIRKENDRILELY